MIISSNKYGGRNEWTPAFGTFFDQSAVDIDGDKVAMRQFAGKVCFVINVASY